MSLLSLLFFFTRCVCPNSRYVWTGAYDIDFFTSPDKELLCKQKQSTIRNFFFFFETTTKSFALRNEGLLNWPFFNMTAFWFIANTSQFYIPMSLCIARAFIELSFIEILIINNNSNDRNVRVTECVNIKPLFLSLINQVIVFGDSVELPANHLGWGN